MPDEIKKGLRYCNSYGHLFDGCAGGCPYWDAKYGCGNNIMIADALAYIQQLEAQVPKWISVKDRLPERWRMDDKDKTLINYMVYMPEYGVDVGNWLKPAKRWVVMGIPANVTHWMPMPEPPKED